MTFCTVEENKVANYKYLMKLATQQKAIKCEKSTGKFLLDFMIENAITKGCIKK